MDYGMNYYETFIAAADDCPVTTGVIPAPRGGRKTVAVLQYELIAEQPYTLTQEDVLFETWRRQQDPPPVEDQATMRERFFAQSRACLRASPLPKQYGWGLHFDSAGRVALCAVGSDDYARLSATNNGTTVLKAMRSRRS